jgi:glutamate N-acetyltransferase/amino-acid N-acetyltransferase
VALCVAAEGTVGTAVFTVNSAAAAPVRLSRQHLAATRAIRAVVLNSGGANAATGRSGDETARMMAEAAAGRVGCDPTQVLVCSTGTIGSALPRNEVLKGIDDAADRLASGQAAGLMAAQAIMTTDSVPKQAAYVSAAGWTVGAMAKGAGMIRPDMATMLAVVTTDAAVDRSELNAALVNAVDRSFHELNIDGCCSTNDTVILLASGASGTTPDPEEFRDAVAAVCRQLAEQMAADAEGASRVVVIHVTGADSDRGARHLGRAVADSALVRSAFYGGASSAHWAWRRTVMRSIAPISTSPASPSPVGELPSSAMKMPWPPDWRRATSPSGWHSGRARARPMY